MSFKSCLRLLPPLLQQVKCTNGLYIGAHVSNNRIGLLCSHNLINSIHVRRFFKDSSKTEVPEGRKRVYYGNLTPQIRTVKWFSLTTSIAGLVAQPIIYNELSKLDNLSLLIAGCSFMGFFTFATPFLLHLVTKKYVTHLDYKPESGTYIATTVNFFCMLKELEFAASDVTVPDVPGMFTTFIAKNKPLFLEVGAFEDPSHYSKIMGYDKPLDFKLYDTSPETPKDKK